MRGRWVHSGGRWFNPVALGSLTRALGVVQFIVGSLGSLACSLRVDGFIWGRWVLTRVLPACRWFYLWSLGSLECALGVNGFI